MNGVNYSVLMSVYHKENPNYLRESILSILQQSVLPNEIIMVKDGELTIELEKVLDEFGEIEIFKTITLKHNVGLGIALSIGLKECKNELIARMDTDDISDHNRCEKQLKKFVENRNLSVVGTAVAEFIDIPSNIVAYKEVKIDNKEIKDQMKFRNPINHPSVMFRKADVLKAGGYKDWWLNEDYYLWIRMMQQGFIFQNINEPLVKMRITNETYTRRSGVKYFITQKRLFNYMLKNDLINIFEYLYNNVLRLVTRILIPNKIVKILYLKFLRSKGVNHD
ncbi:glycosyltransferase [Paenibacillus silagei]|uniref:Glycosyltransferase involved in cell wall biosynthesis n=1 Tax=Paenibacillus silagei TaxID=1670801 RepID=A0ABS4NYA3_9BACL|nr:glycosyltransferase [Paenibacillus silagei]MBP2114399.1 glycosyltransferase involved in cell wall biosynthesis [Paenibacillus silagei]